MRANKPKVILFDVNETLLDMTTLKNKVDTLLGSENGFKVWFGMLLHYSLVHNSINAHKNFVAVAEATLDMAAKGFSKKISSKTIEKVLATIRELPAHHDVKAGLKILKDNGYVLATLTNSPATTLDAQMKYAGLQEYFREMMSVEPVKKYKPAPETYRWAAEQLAVDVNEVMLVAAHGWDVAGAMHAGMQAAFVEREGQYIYPLAPMPNLKGKNLVDIARLLVE
jgi:2-haloacid dehalogenase